MRPSPTRLTKSGLFGLLMLLAALLLLLPAGAKRWMGGILQPIGWLESLITGTVRTTRAIAEDFADSPPTPDQALALRERVEQLERQLAHQSLAMAEQQREIERISRIQGQLNDAQARIIVAPVKAGSSVPRREELSISRGSRSGVKRGDWVAAGRIVPRDSTESGGQLLSREWLIGRVIDVQPYESRVQLATDAAFAPAQVYVARVLEDGTAQRFDEPELLYGEGGGRMAVRSASRNHLEFGYRMVVVQVGGAQSMPLLIGTIHDARPRQDSPLHFDLSVRPPGDARRLDRVYVISQGD